MSKALDEVLAEALRLDPKSRAEIVTELLASLDGPPDPGAEAAWEEEISRRVAAIEAGTVKLEPWDTVRRRIEKALRRR
jgi:putative addiction module component (TIGR02574 family)